MGDSGNIWLKIGVVARNLYYHKVFSGSGKVRTKEWEMGIFD